MHRHCTVFSGGRVAFQILGLQCGIVSMALNRNLRAALTKSLAETLVKAKHHLVRIPVPAFIALANEF